MKEECSICHKRRKVVEYTRIFEGRRVYIQLCKNCDFVKEIKDATSKSIAAGK